MKKLEIKSKKILVIGDIMLDKWNYCSSIKLSQEAPVPVVKFDKIRQNLGGAGNVCRNITSLKNECTYLGVLGKDSNSETITNFLYTDRIKYSLVYDENRSNTIKERFLVDGQHFLRLDHETTTYLDHDIQNQLYNKFINIYKEYDAVILQDYNKGVLTPFLIESIIDLCKKEKIKVYVDPKNKNIYKYKKVWLFKPNRSEFLTMTGLNLETIEDVKEYEEEIIKVKKTMFLDNLLITLGRNGIALFNTENELIYSRELFINDSPVDVTGAGDIVIALYAILDLNDVDESTKLYLCLEGAQKSIIKRGTSVIDLNELNIEVKSE
jgi:rfaE bifunctional protein kinase chain/domain